MTTWHDRGYRLFLHIFATVNGIVAIGFLLRSRPALTTPLFEYPLLASLHAIVLGSLLPLLFARLYRETPAFRLGTLFVMGGGLVVVTGFLLHPRSALPEEGGVMVLTGVVLVWASTITWSLSGLYWTGLLLSSGMGVFLGKTLARPVIDPIPFSTIAVHGFTGAGLGLFPLFWMKKGEGENVQTLVLFVLVFAAMLWVLDVRLVHRSMLLFLAAVILAGFAGIGRSGRWTLFAMFSVVMAGGFEADLLPGEWISLGGMLLLAGCYAGYFLNSGRRADRQGREADTV